MLTYCVAAVGSEIVVGTFQKPAFCRNVQTATYAMALATTATATILIGFTTWNFRRAIRPLLSGNVVTAGGTRHRQRSPVENVLLLLLESGILYFLFFVWPFLPSQSLVDSRMICFIQAIQVVGVVPRVHDWVLTQPGVSFAFTMYSYCSSVIVVSKSLCHIKCNLSSRTRASTRPLSSSLRIFKPAYWTTPPNPTSLPPCEWHIPLLQAGRRVHGQRPIPSPRTRLSSTLACIHLNSIGLSMRNRPSLWIREVPLIGRFVTL